MAVQPYTYLVITDGSLTVTIADGAAGSTKYHLVDPGWAPAVAATRTSNLGGMSPYANVEEEIIIDIEDTTAALCYSDLAVLARLLDRAERWWTKGENITPVQIKYAPMGSTVASTASPYVATILGHASGDETSGVVLPANFDDTGMLYEISDIHVRFWRTGLWQAATETATSASAANPSSLAITMPTAPSTPGMVSLTLSGFTTAAGTGSIDIPSGYILFGPNLDLQQAETTSTTSLAPSATYTSTADATARASSGNVGRLNHTSAALNTESVLTYAPSLTANTAKQVAVYITYRNNSASGWTIRVSGGAGLTTAASVAQTYGPTQTIAAAVTNPTAMYVGTVSSQYSIDYISLNIAVTSISGTATLDIDTIAFVDLSTHEAYVVAVNGARAVLGASVASQNTTIVIDNLPTLIAPDVRIRLSGGQRIPQTYSGSAGLVAKAQALEVIWLAPHLYGGTTAYWTTQNVGGSATLSIAASVTRYISALVPE